ncbi:MAG: hypothetical protein KKH92_02150 [Firmicutes bacterium]|nr:hypothetical protein [Bacillota bacterium]
MNEVMTPLITVDWTGKKCESMHLFALDNNNSWPTDKELEHYFNKDDQSIQAIYSYIVETDSALRAFERYESPVSDLLKAHIDNCSIKDVNQFIVIERFDVDLDEVLSLMLPILEKYL